MASVVLQTVPDIKVLVIGKEDSDDVESACAGAGICWYFTPQASVGDLVRTVSAVSSGVTPCSPRIAAALLRQVSRHTGYQDLNSGLTQREMEIFECLRNGLTNKEIARRLGIRLATVKNHVHNILTKLHAKNRNDAATRRPQK
jgi:DNA-binding NarL/FixJ family response regulator